MSIPNDQIMREMARLATEKAAHFFAQKAEEFAETIPPDADGKTALTAFANAIRSTNTKVYPKGWSS